MRDGGIVMAPLAVVSVIIYWTAFRLYFFFSAHNFYRVSRAHLIQHVFNPILATGELREVLDYTQAPDVKDITEVKSRFAEVASAYLAEVDGMRVYLLILITTAPLLGLLGTVKGMLTTFSGLAISTGGNTVDQIAAGISEALITTQAGLMIAIPAYVMATVIHKRRVEMQSCLTTMETLTIQLFQKKATNGNPT